MSSSVKKSRKREHSPDGQSQATPKRIRGQADTPNDSQFSRPITRSSTPNVLNSSRRISTRKSVQKFTESLVDEAANDGVDVNDVLVAAAASSPRRISMTSTIPTAESTPQKTPQRRRSAASAINVVDYTEYIPAVRQFEPVPENLAVVASTCTDTNELSPPSVSLLPDDCIDGIGSSVRMYIRMSRALVVFIIVMFAFVSLVRLDHDKHDTNGSISRSGRKMYSFLTLGWVQPWEWGAPRRDIYLLKEAESLLARLELELKAEGLGHGEHSNVKALDAVEIAATRVRELLDHPREVREGLDSATLVKVSAEDIRIRLSAASSSPQTLSLALDDARRAAALRHREESHRATTSLPEVTHRDLEDRVDQVLNKIGIVKKDLCTTERCRLWSDFSGALTRARDEIRYTLFDPSDLQPHQYVILKKLSEIVETDMSWARRRATQQHLESALRHLEPACFSASDADNNANVIFACVQNVLVKCIPEVFNADLFKEIQPNKTTVTKATFRKTALQLKVSELLMSQAVQQLLHESTPELLCEEDLYVLCLEKIRVLLRGYTAQVAGDLAALTQSHRAAVPDAEAAVGAPVAALSNLIDYALAPRGGRVVAGSAKTLHSLTAPPLVPSVLHSVGLLGGYGDASVVISSSLPPALGDCYAFAGASGNVTVLLAAPTAILKIGVYQKNEGRVETSAARSFRVFGWTHLPPAMLSGYDRVSLGSHSLGAVLMGDFAMSPAALSPSPGSFQLFALQAPLAEVRAVTIQFDNTAQEEFTCVYRVQLLGNPHQS